MDCLCLTDSMASILSLLVHCRIPISIIEDYAVCSSEIDTDSSTSSGRYEAEDLLVEVELVNKTLSHLNFD